jgi:hypothetical protein
LATRLYSIRMMEQFISNRKMSDELKEFDEKIVHLYTVSSITTIGIEHVRWSILLALQTISKYGLCQSNL